MNRGSSLSSEVGALKENIKKNRYKDILPYDQSRVVLSLLTSDSDSDYINASFIKGAAADSRYIASQGPLISTVIDFWRMIWQHDVKVIVMACREIEMGKKKCECYWSPVQQSAAFGPFTVCKKEETRPNEDIVVRDLTVTYQQESRAVTQYQYLSWPDHDVPYEAAGVLDLLERARTSQGTHSSPLLVHCSAGCGRTGVICALDYIHDLLVTEQINTTDFSIMNIVLQLRRQRPSAVQTKEQYQFIFTAAVCMLERLLEAAADRQLYSNLPQNGKDDAAPLPPKKSAKPPTVSKRLSQQPVMNDTYAVVNKPKHPPTADPAHSAVAPPRSSRTLPPSHYYDNDPAGASAAAVYSTVRPRAKPNSLSLSATPIYNAPRSSNHRLEEEGLLPAERHSSTDHDYEDLSPSVPDLTLCSPSGIGFNCRIQKPRGPRDPPAAWSRLER
ncbi:tyrosine-protein phosphatase non-receptor type 18 isoform X2 [Perca fluviatilis]|uniref:tyrosine-protein phosphatase non-receptor type 18 isoform X2 n=1 Tax=Perca fluviatilis TaxID=8168 RepID=UPI0019642E7F|nr:tyrosine-protein phosphatase non-receptor type 18 isoform X2 [Perca fluviatilis]